MSQTADRYATALFELAQEQKNLEAVQKSLVDLKKIIEASEDFRAFLSNPLLSYDECRTVLKALFEGKVPGLTYRFLVFITLKGRLSILGNVIGSFDSMYLESTHQMRTQVKTAFEMKDKDKKFIDKVLQDKFHQKVMTNWTIDPSLIGGFRIFAQGKLYDYSFKDQLDSFLQLTT